MCVRVHVKKAKGVGTGGRFSGRGTVGGRGDVCVRGGRFRKVLENYGGYHRKNRELRKKKGR